MPETLVDFDRSYGRSTRSDISADALTSSIVLILREHYSNPEKFIFNGNTRDGPGLSRYRWVSENNTGTAPLTKGNSEPTSSIQIADTSEFNQQDTARRPAIYVKRGDWDLSRLTVGGRIENSQFIKDEHGRVMQDLGEKYAKKIEGTHTIWHIGATHNSKESEMLASETAYILSFLELEISSCLGMYTFQVSKIGSHQEIPEFRKHYGTPVIVAYIIIPTWHKKQLAPILNSISIESSLR